MVVIDGAIPLVWLACLDHKEVRNKFGRCRKDYENHFAVEAESQRSQKAKRCETGQATPAQTDVDLLANAQAAFNV